MKLNTNLPGFNGYYGSFFEDTDTSSEIDYINEQRQENGLLPLENENDINWDYNDYYSQLNMGLTSCVEDFLIDFNIVKSIKFIKLHSPKFYNYSNDVIECKIDVNVSEVKKYILENKDTFEAYLIDNFKSRSGFSSFYEYDLSHWIGLLKSFKKLDHIEIHAFLNFILENESFNIVDHLYNGGMFDIPILQASNIDELTTI